MVVVLALLVALGVGAFFYLRNRGGTEPIPGQERCVATANDRVGGGGPGPGALRLDHRRAVGPSRPAAAGGLDRDGHGLPGDRDPQPGLRRPGLGRAVPAAAVPGLGHGRSSCSDPYYATGKFYDALVKIDGWESGDINDVAQQVQRSGYPEAYRDHETDARVLASTLTGHSPAGFRCLDRSNTPGDPDGLARSLPQDLRPRSARRPSTRPYWSTRAPPGWPGRTRTTRWPTRSTTA